MRLYHRSKLFLTSLVIYAGLLAQEDERKEIYSYGHGYEAIEAREKTARSSITAARVFLKVMAEDAEDAKDAEYHRKGPSSEKLGRSDGPWIEAREIS